eukprot:TRINITY_DN44481_c0_g1_i1.p1 TRINITY_DN44481_c0_g1~~TRINITY_DN44481_c0_g1_i1.p1  ORF type:complete len:406 (+),score=54.29 TRINITY_DN44481_c0_g1_i1:182-1219(+)
MVVLLVVAVVGCFQFAVSQLAPGPSASVPSAPALAAPAPCPPQVNAFPPKRTHFLTGADAFLRGSSRRVGQSLSSIIGTQSSLDDMKQDLAVEYDRWQTKSRLLTEQRSKLQAEAEKLRGELLEQRSLKEEKLRLEGELAMARDESRVARVHRASAKHVWPLERKMLISDTEQIEKQMAATMTESAHRVAVATNRTSELMGRNRNTQTIIYHLNQQAVQLEFAITNRSLESKKEQAYLLSNVASLQAELHNLQDDVVARAKVQLEIQRFSRRLSAQAGEVVVQKEQLQHAKATCEKEIASVNAEISRAKQILSAATAEIARCQGLDAENQRLQGQLNECRARQRR